MQQSIIFINPLSLDDLNVKIKRDTARQTLTGICDSNQHPVKHK